jgi:hypothetical protein
MSNAVREKLGGKGGREVSKHGQEHTGMRLDGGWVVRGEQDVGFLAGGNVVWFPGQVGSGRTNAHSALVAISSCTWESILSRVSKWRRNLS